MNDESIRAHNKNRDYVMGELEEILQKLKRKYGPSLVLKGSDIKMVELDRAPTGSFSLDVETGGGLPYGRIIEFFGKESSGKSTMALKVAASVQKEERKVVWIDVEHSFDPRWASLMGVDLEKLTVSYPQTAEEALDVLEAVLRSNECGLVVLDSIAALQPSADLEKSMEDPEKIGSRATLLTRAMSRLLSALNSYDEEDNLNQCMILLINQVREKIGIVYGNPETTPGGKAVRHSAAVRVKFVHGQWIERDNPNTGEKDKVGHIIKFRTEKNKTFIPFREGQFNLYFTGEFKGQIDVVEEVVRYGQLYGIIESNGRTFKYDNLKAVGRDNFVKLLRSEPKLVERIKKEVLEVSRKT